MVKQASSAYSLAWNDYKGVLSAKQAVKRQNCLNVAGKLSKGITKATRKL